MKSTVASLWTSAVRSIRSATASARKRAAAWTLPRSFIAGFRNVLDALRPDERQQSERFVPQRAASLVCAGLVFAAGVIMVGIESRWSKILTRASYDWSFGLGHLTQRVPKELNTVIVYVDANSLAELGQSSSEPMDRSLHARLLRRLKADGARTVVMDIVFSELGPHHEADEDLADAIGANGQVVLAQDLSPGEVIKGLTRKALTPLYAPFNRATAAKGLDLLQPDSDFLVRRHTHSFEGIENAPASLSWVAAQRALKSTGGPFDPRADRWIYYYGPPEALPHIGYKHALETPTGYFRGKTVFIGLHPSPSAFMEKRAELRSPFSANSGPAQMSTVEVHATQFLNLVRNDWLRRPGPAWEIAILAVTALAFGFGLLRFSPVPAAGFAVIGGLGFAFITQIVFQTQHVWFAWLIPVLVQIPAALFFSIISHSLEWVAQHRKLQEQRRRADVRIREQATLLDQAQDAIIVHDLDWCVHYWNKSAERLYGWSYDEVWGKNLRTEIFKTEMESVTAFEQTLSHGEWLGELTQMTKEQEELVIQSRWTLVRDEEEKPKAIFVINTNITEQKRLEAQFLRTQRVESIGNLASGIAHDLNNVLTPILIGVQLLKLKVTDESGRKMLTTMESSAKRGADMIRQVLAFGRGHEGKRTLVYFNNLIREMQKIIVETFPRNIEVQVQAEESDPILGDPTQMHQILLNLCVNARDAMADGGRIVLSARNCSLSKSEAAKFAGAKAGKHILLSVADNGTGIPPEIMDRIFEPFYTTKEVGKGTGLGLSTVMTIVKAHGGFFDLRSRPGKGTTFNIYFPRADIMNVVKETAGPTRTLSGKGETVMVVDDDAAVLDLTSELLIQNGYKVITAKNGADAVALYSRRKDLIKMVIMDMMMPVMDGVAAIKALKKQQPKLRIVATSGLAAAEKLNEIPGGGEIPFLSKPCAPEKLLEQLKGLLSPAKI